MEAIRISMKSIRISKSKRETVCSWKLKCLHFRYFNLKRSNSCKSQRISNSVILDRSRYKVLKSMFCLLQLKKSGICWGFSFNRFKGSSLVLDLLFHNSGNSMDTSISSIQKLGSSLGSNSKRKDNQKLHIGLVNS